jgi:hypothetical protein
MLNSLPVGRAAWTEEEMDTLRVSASFQMNLKIQSEPCAAPGWRVSGEELPRIVGTAPERGLNINYLAAKVSRRKATTLVSESFAASAFQAI